MNLKVNCFAKEVVHTTWDYKGIRALKLLLRATHNRPSKLHCCHNHVYLEHFLHLLPPTRWSLQKRKQNKNIHEN